MSVDAPLVFHWNDPLQERMEQAGVVFATVMLATIPIIFFYSFPLELLAKVDWRDIWQKMSEKPTTVVKILSLIVAFPLCFGVAIWAQKAHKRNARVLIDDTTVRYVSGIPWIGKWIDWTWDLEAIRTNKLVLKVVNIPLNSQPLRTCRLSWGQFINKQMRPYVWQLPGQSMAPVAKPQSFLGLVRWNTPANATLLQQQFDQLPLVTALRQRGITLPPISDRAQHYPGMDLMAQPRMRLAVWAFFGAMAAAFALFHAMRHQHYFTAPPGSVWIGMGLLAGLGMLAWLWQEQAEGGAQAGKQLLEFRSTQVIVASLFALAVGLCVPSLPLVLSSLAKSSQDTAFTLQKPPLLLRAKPGSGTPDLTPHQALDYWASLPNGETITLPVRQGFAGWWWQFDSSVLSDKLDAFYDAQDRVKPKRK
jgi:hypothetical protein